MLALSWVHKTSTSFVGTIPEGMPMARDACAIMVEIGVRGNGTSPEGIPMARDACAIAEI